MIERNRLGAADDSTCVAPGIVIALGYAFYSLRNPLIAGQEGGISLFQHRHHFFSVLMT
jgi:hypothetical protein